MAQNYCLSQCFRAHAHSYCWRRLLALKLESIARASVLVARKYCSCQLACLPLSWIGSSASWVSLTFFTQSRARQLENSSAWSCQCHFPLVCSKDGMVAFHCCSLFLILVVWVRHQHRYPDRPCLGVAESVTLNWRRFLTSTIPHWQLKQVHFLPSQKFKTSQEFRKDHLSFGWVDTIFLWSLGSFEACEVVIFDIKIKRLRDLPNLHMAFSSRGAFQRIHQKTLEEEFKKMTVRGTMVRSEVCNSWCFCLES